MKKKTILIGAILVSIFLVVGWWLFTSALPNYAANLITEKAIPDYFPEKYKVRIEEIKKPIAEYSEEAFRISDSLNLDLELILKIIDSVDPDEVMLVYEQLENKEVTNSEEVFKLIFQNVTIKEVDIKVYKKVFVKHATPRRINRLLRYVEKNDLVATMAPSTAKKIAREIAIKHYDSKLRNQILE